MPRHFLSLLDLSADQALHLLELASRLKLEPRAATARLPLAGQTLGLVFDKPSMRTRISFEAAMAQLGGASIFLNGKDVGIGSREPLQDFARIISEYVDILAVRTFAQSLLVDLAQLASIPIINALTDDAHPCQAMADLLTIRESIGRLDGVRLTFVGDGNNVARSLAVGSALTGVEFTLAAPPAYGFPDWFHRAFTRRFPGQSLRVLEDPRAAVHDAQVIYTDVWTSMGQESETDQRVRDLAPYQVDAPLMAHARPGALFLHCLPARRGQEVTSEVIDGPNSLIIPQAANRLHFQKALLLWMLER